MSQIYEALQRAERERAQTAAGVAVLSDPAETTTQPASRSDDSALSQAVAPLAAREPATEAAVAAPALSATVHVWSPNLEALPALAERGAAIEQFRRLRSHLLEARDVAPLKSVLISSGMPQEGKSYIAANLAIALARDKKSRVLLIDGDMRRSSLHKTLGAPGAPGLTNLLANTASIADYLQRPRSSQGSPLVGLDLFWFLPGGEETSKAADLAGNLRFAELIAEAAPHFDWIVVDSAPVNLVADGVNLAHSCDAVLLVARAGVTRFEDAQTALNRLKTSRVLGVVLNALEQTSDALDYYGYESQPPS